MKIYSRYKPGPKDGMTFTEESLTHQEFYEDTKTENIINKYVRIGANPYLPAAVGEFLDTTTISDFQTNMERFRAVSEYFESLPSDIRLQFRNDPKFFAQFASNPENKNALEELGLIPESKELKDINPTPQDAPAFNGGVNSDEAPASQDVSNSDNG
ncbi:hypothetical protein [Turicimonas muris]|uniref:hypothetical protein n=1 Tax=Turicimonas muris TaxID=1796652 RepID=UPI0023F21C0F|nr:hypothetical protein [Turicimonas muris]